MKYRLLLVFLVMLMSASAVAQGYKKHKVAKGETVADIAKKYKVTPYDIYRLNPDSKNGVKENSIILVPNQSKPETTAPVAEKPTKVVNTEHIVVAKESLYSLSKKYGVTVDEIKKANGTSVDSGLQIGQKVIIPIKGSAVAAEVKEAAKADKKATPPSYFFHTVAAGETKYSIAKQYGMTLQLLEAMNPEAKDTLAIGQKLKLDRNAVIEKETQPAPAVITPQPAAPATQKVYTEYTIQPKETLFSLSRRAGITEEEFIAINPQLKEGVKEGMVIKWPVSVPAPPKGLSMNLASSLNKSTPKELAILIPFNLTKTESDTVRKSRLRSEKFLNMTLDFYSGALMAVDSAKALGLPVKVRIIDSKESRNTSDVASVKSSLAGANAIIGPFFQNNVETTASMFPNTPVISPLSKESGTAYANLYNSVPSPDMVKTAMLNWLKVKGGNVLAIVDSKKASSRQLIKNVSPEVKFIDGGVTDASVRAQLSKDGMNYVIMETESTNMILNVTKVLAALLPEYQIQLVVLERSETLDFDEIPLDKLTALKMLYPSVTNEAETPNVMLFNRLYREKNGIAPSQFATRGFDVTFDVIMRLFQAEQFGNAMTNAATEYVENKFTYVKSDNGNNNTGVFILQYNPDLTVTQAQ
ncbi:MAG: LysM peptidoglycan-binding domain-containing protein [Flavobacterium sp.]